MIIKNSQEARNIEFIEFTLEESVNRDHVQKQPNNIEEITKNIIKIYY